MRSMSKKVIEKATNNKILLAIFIFLILLNSYLFYYLNNNKIADLYIEKVSYLDQENEWEITTNTTRPLADQEAEVRVLFTDGTKKTETWPLIQKKKSWNYKSTVPVDSVTINAPPEYDWNQENSQYVNDLWSKEIKLFTLDPSAESCIIPGKDNTIYLIYTDRIYADRTKNNDSGNNKDIFRIYLKKYTGTGKLILGPHKLYESNVNSPRHPFIHLINQEKEKIEAVAGWNIITRDDKSKSISTKFNKITIGDNNITSEELPLFFNNNTKENDVKFYDRFYHQGNKNLSLLAGFKNKFEFKWKVLRYNEQIIEDSIEISPGVSIEQTDDLILGRLICYKNYYYIFWILNEKGDKNLYYTKTDMMGKIISKTKKIYKISKLRYSRPENFQILSIDGRGFHIGWIELSGTIKVTEKLNYLIIDLFGNVIDAWIPFSNHTSGFSMAQKPTGNIEIYLARDNRDMNRDIYKVKISPDLQLIHSPRLLISTRNYEEHPSIYIRDNSSYLFWVRDKDYGSQYFFSTTDSHLKDKINRQNMSYFKNFLLEKITVIIILLVISLLFIFFSNLLPIIVLIIYNYPGKYLNKNFLYWINAALLLIPLKLYSESLMLKWDHPLMADLYRLHLIIFVCYIVIAGILWFKTKEQKNYRSISINRLITVWLCIDSIFIYFIYLKNIDILSFV